MSSRIHAARFDEALQALDFYVGWAGGWLCLERRREDRTRLNWMPANSGRLAETVRDLDERHSDELVFGLPMRERFHGGVGNVTVLWARVEGADQARRANAFRPRPTVVLREGQSSRRLLIWALEEAVSYFAAVEHNRRLAYALHAVQKWGDPDVLRIPCPGTCLRLDRARPVPVVCARLTLRTFRAADVTRKLREPPARDAWMTGTRG